VRKQGCLDVEEKREKGHKPQLGTAPMQKNCKEGVENGSVTMSIYDGPFGRAKESNSWGGNVTTVGTKIGSWGEIGQAKRKCSKLSAG